MYYGTKGNAQVRREELVKLGLQNAPLSGTQSFW